MTLEIGLVLKRKDIIYEGKKQNIFKVEGMEVGYCDYCNIKFYSLSREYNDNIFFCK